MALRTLSLLRRYTLWIGFGAALAALSILLYVQYGWLRQLEDTSARAHRATLLNYIGTVASEVRYFYRSNGERVLNVPFAAFSPDHLDRAAHHFATRGALGARHLFAVTFIPGAGQHLLVFDPARREAVLPSDDEARAIEVATAPWRTLALRGVIVDQIDLAADERDRAHRMVLNAVTDEASHVVGVAGMILDPQYFRERVLPTAVQRASHALAIPGVRRDPVVAALNGDGQVVWKPEEREVAPSAPWEVQQRLTFVFTDWRFAAHGRRGVPAEWADRNFKLNLALCLALAASLLGGLLIAVRAASQEMALSRLKSDFVSNVSHELRTPLASIRLFAELLRLGRVGTAEKVRTYGEHIEAESRRLSQLIHNLLDFASMEAGHKTYRFASVDLVAMVDEVLNSFSVRAHELGFTLQYNRPTKPLPALSIDRDALISAFTNLLDNAIKYSGTGREVSVELATEEREVVLTVHDHGIGIPRKEQRKIFDRFHRVSTGMVHEVRGSGLGLSIVRHIVNGHGGRITVDSRPGQGSTFAIHLPLPHAELAPPPSTEPSLHPAAQHLDSYGTS